MPILTEPLDFALSKTAGNFDLILKEELKILGTLALGDLTGLYIFTSVAMAL